MKIAIVSDSHDNIKNIDKVLSYLTKHKICKLIHCGDLTSHETLSYIAQRFDGKVWIARGNAEMFQTKNEKSKIKNNRLKLKIFEEIGTVDINGVKIGFAHEPKNIKKLVNKNLDFVFYGHTHKPWIEIKRYKDKKVIMANPGNLFGQPYEATFAILNTENKKLELKII